MTMILLFIALKIYEMFIEFLHYFDDDETFHGTEELLNLILNCSEISGLNLKNLHVNHQQQNIGNFISFSIKFMFIQKLEKCMGIWHCTSFRFDCRIKDKNHFSQRLQDRKRFSEKENHCHLLANHIISPSQQYYYRKSYRLSFSLCFEAFILF